MRGRRPIQGGPVVEPAQFVVEAEVEARLLAVQQVEQAPVFSFSFAVFAAL